jgi:hypothetical protein
MIRVKATREGLPGRKTASGWTIDNRMPYVALPSERALYRFVRIAANGRSAIAIVLDVGPWNTADDAYVFGSARPQAESGTDERGRLTNGAGIDLGESIWRELEMTDNGPVDWEFL